MFVCGKCGGENDDRRTVCFVCGAKLDTQTSKFVAGEPNGFTGGGLSAPKITNPKALPKKSELKRASMFRWFHLLFLLPIAAFVASFYFMLQPPERIFVSANPGIEESARLESFLKAAAKSPSGAWSATPQAINQYLATKVKTAPLANALGVNAQMTSCWVELNEGFLDVQMKLKISDRDCYLNLRMKPVTNDGRLGIACTSASIGRLPIPSTLAQFGLPLLTRCLASLETFIAAVSTAEKAEISRKNIVIRWPASADKRP